MANCQEWKSAQKSPQQLAALKRRLSDAVGPVFDAEDFQWPWFEMSGEHWDNDNRYEESLIGLDVSVYVCIYIYESSDDAGLGQWRMV